MKPEMINGIIVPYNLSTKQLIDRLHAAADMSCFSVCCTALSYKDDEEAYEALLPYLSDNDYHKRLYVFGVISVSYTHLFSLVYHNMLPPS